MSLIMGSIKDIKVILNSAAYQVSKARNKLNESFLELTSKGVKFMEDIKTVITEKNGFQLADKVKNITLQIFGIESFTEEIKTAVTQDY